MIYYKGVPINELSKQEKNEYDNLLPIPPHGDYMGSPHLFNGNKIKNSLWSIKYIIAAILGIITTMLCRVVFHTSDYNSGVFTMIIYFNTIKFIKKYLTPRSL